jgi:hypothetical protein
MHSIAPGPILCPACATRIARHRWFVLKRVRVLSCAIFVAIDLARSAWLRSRADIRWINQGSMERRASGRWTPE